VTRVRISPGREVARSREGGKNRLFATGDLELPESCSHFASLDQRAARLATVPGGKSTSEMRAWLGELAAEGWLFSKACWHESFRSAHHSPPNPSTLDSMVIVTRERPASLRRVARSYAEEWAAQGRRTPIQVLDDSATPESRSQNQMVLREVQAEWGVAFAYAGLSERIQFAQRLALRTGAHPGEIAHALLPTPDFRAWAQATMNRHALGHRSILEAQLSAHQEAPAFWRKDVSRYLTLLTEASQRPDYWFPLDFAADPSPKDAAAAVAGSLGQLGRMLKLWPQLREDALNMVHSGQGLFQSIDG